MSLPKKYLNLLPLNGDALDIFSVFNRAQPQVSKWMDMLLSQAHWEMDIHAEFSQTDMFRHLYVESKNVQKARGQHTLGFGFPIIIDSNILNKPISAPLFIWHLNIKPHPTRRDSWLVSFDEGAPVALNEYLMQHIADKYGWQLTEPLSEFAHKRPMTRNGFENTIKDLAHKLLFDHSVLLSGGLTAPRDCPTEKEIKEIATSGDIILAGVFGLFPYQSGALADLKNIEDVDFQNFTWTAEHAHEFSVLPDDAYQREALRTVLRNKITVVEGAYGTGKTHLAANILINALSNGQKTAVVANDIPSLMQVQNMFVNLGLGNLTFLLQDVYFDKKLLLDVLKSEFNAKTVKFDEDEFKIALKQARRLLNKSDDSHEALSRHIFGNDTFSEVVGRFLAAQRVEGRELLANHLNANDYVFSLQEYNELRSCIESCAQLYPSVNTLKHPLSHLHPTVYEADKSDKGRTFAMRRLDSFIEKCKSLHHRHIVLYDNYAQKLMQQYEKFYNDVWAQLRLFKESYSDFQFQFGDDFENNGFFKMSGLRAAALFSDRSKNVLSAKEDVLNQYEGLEKIFNTHKYFTHTFLKGSDVKDFTKLKLNLETFELSLRGWRKALPSIMQEELQRLNSKTATHFDKKAAEDIKVVEDDLDNLLREINLSNLYDTPLSHKMLTLPKRMLYVEETIEKLEETKLNMRDFEGVYAWQRYWLNMPDIGRKTVQALIKVKPKNWLVAFDSWYFYNLLVAHYQSDTLSNDELMRQMNAAEDRLRKLLPAQIANLWHERKMTAIQALKAKDPDAYRWFFNSKNHQLTKNKYLKQILKKTMPTLSHVYPVLLMTPQVASQVIEGDGKEFDLVIFDNAQHIEADSVVPILRNTEGVVILAEKAQNSDISPDALPELAKKHQAATVQLNHLHRSMSETVRRINQTVFYKNLDIPFKQAAGEQSVKIVHLSKGRLIEKSQTNDLELEEIVKILEEVHTTPFNTYPRIGVVTMQKKQRNALTMNLLHIIQKAMPGWERIEQMQRNGLNIFSIDEIDGFQFDILIVSGTYDSTTQIGFSLAQFRTLLNCFKQKIIWLNSIPTEELKQAATQYEPENAFLLANLILLAEHIQSQNGVPTGDANDRIFKVLRERYETNTKLPNSIFMNEIEQSLTAFIEKKYLSTNHTIDNHTFPLVILPKHEGQLPMVVRIDGRLSKGKTFNPTWESRLLSELNLPVISVWSYNWWRDPKEEVFRLAQSIFEYDRQFEKKAEETFEKLEGENPLS